MAPKRMKIVNVEQNIVVFRGYGYDENALAMGVSLLHASFENYGVIVMIENNENSRPQPNQSAKIGVSWHTVCYRNNMRGD